MVALAYLFCVLAPTLSLALPGNQVIPHCLTEDGRANGLAHVHGMGVAQHVHEGGQIHSHMDGQGLAAGDYAEPMALSDSSAPVKAAHHSEGKCCGLICITALPAADVTLAKPLLLQAVRMSEVSRKLADNSPSRLYRPPIS